MSEFSAPVWCMTDLQFDHVSAEGGVSGMLVAAGNPGTLVSTAEYLGLVRFNLSLCSVFLLVGVGILHVHLAGSRVKSPYYQPHVLLWLLAPHGAGSIIYCCIHLHADIGLSLFQPATTFHI